MNKLLELLKRKLMVIQSIDKDEKMYLIGIHSNQITEEEYNLIKEFIQRKDEEENGN
jgi:hypothetical protein